jgi:aryl-alcohol dehydrogenase-like predicted oxidoreductase
VRYRYLGKSGLNVSELAMGTQTFGWGVDERTAHHMADQFVDSGGNLFDTSSTYNEGASESMLGTWLRSRKNRDAMVVATKVFFATGTGRNELGLSRKHILQSAEESLRRLQTDYIDLYQAHCCDLATPIEETLSAFDDLVRAGKVLYLGVSNFTASGLLKAVLTARRNCGAGLVSLQAEYSLLVRETEWELLPLCREEGLGLLAWSPLAGGWLTGKYSRDSPPSPDTRVGRGDRWDDLPDQRESDLAWRVIERLREIAAKRGKTPAQVALNYLLRRSSLVVPIFGARTPDQLRQNLGSVGWELEQDEVSALSEASSIPLPYPFRFIERYGRKRNDAGEL